MPNYLEGPDEKVKRAYKHIDELKRENDRFLLSEPHPYGVVPDRQTEPGRTLYRLHVREDPPLRIAAILSDIFQNLRSALDYLACQCILFGGGCLSRNSEFPIKETLQDFEAALQTKVSGATKDCLDLIRAAKPYKGGNDSLWQLHHLNRLDKHRLLSVLGGASDNTLGLDIFRSMSETWEKISDKPLDRTTYPIIWIRGIGRTFPLIDGQVLTSQPTEHEADLHFGFYIGFSQAGYADGEPILDTARKFADVVKGIIESFRPVLV